MTKTRIILLDGPEARDRARELIGVMPRGTVVVFLPPEAGPHAVASRVLLKSPLATLLQILGSSCAVQHTGSSAPGLSAFFGLVGCSFGSASGAMK